MKRLALGLAMLLALSACGSPTQTYVANKDVGAFFTVPRSWFEVTPEALDKAEFAAIESVQAQQRYDLVRWQIAYAPTRVRGAEVLATDARDIPVAFLRVRDLSDAERASVSLNTLRDLVFPVTQGSLPITVDSDEEISQPGGSGVDLTYEITLNEKAQKLRQIAVLTPDRRTVYLFVLRCSTTCFTKSREQISNIAASFTVRGPSV